MNALHSFQRPRESSDTLVLTYWDWLQLPSLQDACCFEVREVKATTKWHCFTESDRPESGRERTLDWEAVELCCSGGEQGPPPPPHSQKHLSVLRGLWDFESRVFPFIPAHFSCFKIAVWQVAREMATWGRTLAMQAWQPEFQESVSKNRQAWLCWWVIRDEKITVYHPGWGPHSTRDLSLQENKGEEDKEEESWCHTLSSACVHTCVHTRICHTLKIVLRVSFWTLKSLSPLSICRLHLKTSHLLDSS